MQRWVSTVNVCSYVCMCGYFVNGVCVHLLLEIYRDFVEAYRELLELVCEACNVTLGSQVWRHVNCASLSSYTKASASYRYAISFGGHMVSQCCLLTVKSYNSIH